MLNPAAAHPAARAATRRLAPLSVPLLLLLALFCGQAQAVAAATGQELTEAKWWRNAQVSQRVGLTKDQKSRLDAMYLENQQRLIRLRAVVEEARLKLDQLIDADPLDEAAIAAEYERLRVAREGLAAERFRYLLEVRRLLGPEQYQKLKAAFREYRQPRPQTAPKPAEKPVPRDQKAGGGQ